MSQGQDNTALEKYQAAVVRYGGCPLTPGRKAHLTRLRRAAGLEEEAPAPRRKKKRKKKPKLERLKKRPKGKLSQVPDSRHSISREGWVGTNWTDESGQLYERHAERKYPKPRERWFRVVTP